MKQLSDACEDVNDTNKLRDVTKELMRNVTDTSAKATTIDVIKNPSVKKRASYCTVDD